MTDAQIVKFATAFRDGLLDGRSSHLMCAAVSLPLSALLRLHGVSCETAEGENGAGGHTWIRLADGRVLDPTADQYNFPCFKQYPPIYLGPPTELHDPNLGYSPDAIAMEAATAGETCNRLAPKDDSAGRKASPNTRSEGNTDASNT